MKEALIRARQIIWRYRHETPLVNQPHMIAIDADEAFELIDAALAQDEPWCMKMNGCTSKCEDCPVEVAEPQPVAWYVERQHIGFRDHGLKYGLFWKLSEAEELIDPIHILKPLYTTPPQPEERNFCSRCGKRTADLTVIHTCTPPQENT